MLLLIQIISLILQEQSSLKNEDRKLNAIEGNKSMQMRLFLGTTNTKLTPQIELQRCSVYAISTELTLRLLIMLQILE